MSIELHNLSFCYPTANKPIIENVTLTFPTALTGVVGDNGAGKSTLLKLIYGSLTSYTGSIKRRGIVGYLPQDLIYKPELTITDLIGISDKIRALEAIEVGSMNIKDFDIVGDEWDIRERALAMLSKHVPSLGTQIDLERISATISGGEILRIALLGLQLRGCKVALLDEPTNNLDMSARQEVYAALRQYRQTALVVSHDLELLEMMDYIAEIRQGNLRIFTGNYQTYQDTIAIEQAVAKQEVADAIREQRLAQQAKITAQIRMDRAVRKGRKAEAQRKFPHKQAGAFASQQQEAHGKLRKTIANNLARTEQTVYAAKARVRVENSLCIALPDPHLALQKDVVKICHAAGILQLRGPERIAIFGNNGAGKTTLLHTILGAEFDLGIRGQAQVAQVGIITQKIDSLGQGTVFEVVKSSTCFADDKELRNQLAKLRLHADLVNVPLDTISGGERFRVALACVLLRQPSCELILLDEPTNNIDTSTRNYLIEAINAYKGAIIVVSHDKAFCESINVNSYYWLQADKLVAVSIDSII